MGVRAFIGPGCRTCGHIADSQDHLAGDQLDNRTLVIEHAFLADAETRARVVRAGVAITVQHPLLYSLGGSLVRHWGPERASQVMPVSAWLADGALVAAGSDCNVSFFDPLLSIWGLVTRGTRTVGVQGPQYRVDRYTAVDLYTAAGGRLLGEAQHIGTLAPPAYADLVAFRTDLMECPADDLPSLKPAFTLVGGRPAYDPDHHLTAPAGLREPSHDRHGDTMTTTLVRVVGRVAWAVPLFLVVSLLSFLLVSLVPGNAAETILGPTAAPSQIQSLRCQPGLSQPLLVQYGTWPGHALHGNPARRC